ncbi:MAG: hypothetical protein ACP6IP_08540 [Candidatus Njordarchaeia archaeon]
MDSITFQIEKNRYRGIIAHRDLDGAIAAGLISKLFPLEIEFLREVTNAEDMILLETPLGLGGKIKGCLIIDHHMCHELMGYMGNVIICDESYPSLVSLVSNFFGLSIDNKLRKIIDDIDSGNIMDSEASKKVFLAYLSNYQTFPFNKLVKLVKASDWDGVFDFFDKIYDEEKVKSIETMAAKKVNNSEKISENVILIVYDPEQDMDYAASRLASLILQDKGAIVITVAVKDGLVLYGTIATEKGINLKPIYKKFKKMGWRSGGRKNVGGFKVPHMVSLNEFKHIVSSVLFKNNKY